LPLTEQEMQTVCEISRQLPSIRNFSAKGSSFKLADIASWPHFGKLKCLELMGDNVTDRDLVTIGGLSHLERLHMESSQVTDAGLQHLASLTQLQELGIFSNTVGDAGLAHLGGLKKIWKLYLGCPQIGDAGVLSLSPANLRRVSLRDCQVGDRGLSHLVSGGHIDVLSVEGTRITDACLADLAKCKYLYRLDLIKTKVTGTGFIELAGSRLNFLCLDGSPITDKGLEHLGSLGRDKKLSSLSLRDTQVTGVGAVHLTGYEFISFLDLSGAPLTRDGIEQLARTKVSNLNVSRTPIGDEELPLFVGMDDTRELDVRQTKVTPLGVRRFMDAREKRCVEANTSNSLSVISDFKYDELPPSELKPEDYPLPPGIPAEAGDTPIPNAPAVKPPSPE
jgi:internalin A